MIELSIDFIRCRRDYAAICEVVWVFSRRNFNAIGKVGCTSLATQDPTNETALQTEELSGDVLSVDDIAQSLSDELHIGRQQIARTLTLLDEGNTISFITRYRKEVTGSLEEVQIQAIADRSAALRALYERKARCTPVDSSAG